jgi:hypothetical protein
MDGGPFDSRAGEIIASNGAIHGHMVETVRSKWSRNWTN